MKSLEEYHAGQRANEAENQNAVVVPASVAAALWEDKYKKALMRIEELEAELEELRQTIGGQE